MHHNHIRLHRNRNTGLWWYGSKHIRSYILCAGHERDCVPSFHVIHNVQVAHFITRCATTSKKQKQKKTQHNKSAIHIKHILNARKIQPVNLPAIGSEVEILCIYFIAFIKAHHSLQYLKHSVKGLFPLHNGVSVCTHSIDSTKYCRWKWHLSSHSFLF